MGQMVYLIAGFTIFLVLFLVLSAVTRSGWVVRQRLDEVRSIDLEDSDDEMQKPFVERAIKPIYDQLFKLISRLTPGNISESYQETLLQAGLANKYTPNRILLNQVLLAVIFMFGFGVIMKSFTSSVNWLFLILIGFIGFYIPLVFFRAKARERQDEIKKALPDLLDMLYISVEAGLSFDAAMKTTAQKMKGPLSQEITRAMDDISKGRDREEALRSIGLRTRVDDVASFITAIIQSEQLGSNIANMLRIQSRVMREKRRQRAEEAAMKIPLKMLFPLIFFLFPALLIVILGPAMISIVETLSGM